MQSYLAFGVCIIYSRDRYAMEGKLNYYIYLTFTTLRYIISIIYTSKQNIAGH
jgi:hypothetical protein